MSRSDHDQQPPPSAWQPILPPTVSD